MTKARRNIFKQIDEASRGEASREAKALLAQARADFNRPSMFAGRKRTPEQRAKERIYEQTPKRRAYNLAKAKARNASAREWLAVLKAVPCVDCGGVFPPECMDFDHRDATTKLFAVAARQSMQRSRLEAEIAKCDIVCANCHRTRTKQRKQGVYAGTRRGRPAA